MTSVPLLELEHVSKSFDATQAVRDVSFSVGPGEFIGLVGPNGAGKSTLIKILDGVCIPDRGTIRAGGKPVATGSRVPSIGVVHQDLGVVPTLTVVENLRLGMPPLTLVGPFISTKMEREFCADALQSVGLSPELGSRVIGSLSLGEQTLVAVARTFARGAKLAVVDEATSALSPAESEWLMNSLRERTATGSAVMVVSHKMSEIIANTDRCLVMIDGAVAVDMPTASTDVVELSRLMSSAARAHVVEALESVPEPPRRAVRSPGEPILRLAGAYTGKRGPFDLTVHAGEIVGVTGLVGSGLYDLAWLAAGVTTPTRGTRTLPRGVRVALLPPDRRTEANFVEYSAAWNLTVGVLERWRTPLRLVSLHREHDDACRRHRELHVVPDDPRHPQGALSGGNQQKILLGRALLQSSTCMVLCEPTRGVDVRARAEIYRLVEGAAAAGAAVLVVSSDHEDLLALSSRVGVVGNGRLDALTPLEELDDEGLAAFL